VTGRIAIEAETSVGSGLSPNGQRQGNAAFNRTDAMHPAAKPAGYYAGCNQSILKAVPPAARTILEVGCGEGQLGARLKQFVPERSVFGIEREPAVAARATARLDRVFVLDVEKDDPPLEPDSLDCILYGDVLEHLVDPEAVLIRHRRFLKQNGSILCSVPNVQHHSLLTALLCGDWQYTTAGLLDSTHLRFFSYSTFFKLLLDAGYAPVIADVTSLPPSPEFVAAAEPLVRHLGLHPGRTHRFLGAYQYLFRGEPLPEADHTEGSTKDLCDSGPAETPLTFVACVSDEPTLHANLLSSPCLGPGSPHEVLLMRGCRNAADGLNQGIGRARHRLVVCLHQDMYLPRNWPQRFLSQYGRAARSCGNVGVVGVYGVARRGDSVLRAGHVVDRDRLLREPARLPALIETLDEILLAVPKDTPLAFDPRLGFHFYGADLCLAARQRGLAAVAVDALCFHNGRNVDLTPDFYRSGAAFAAKWSPYLPVATSCAVVDQRWCRETAAGLPVCASR
jgi:hypothetical protein